MADRRPAKSPRREWFREKFPLMAPDSSLWRSRGTKGWVRAVPGAPPAAAEGMDGPDDARTESPWWGRGFNPSSWYEYLYITNGNQEASCLHF